ncbi:MAG: ABC transporter permease [Candidimonas sp.]|nr:MAG: ABC transporter permease [Candidimonas sp.]
MSEPVRGVSMRRAKPSVPLLLAVTPAAVYLAVLLVIPVGLLLYLSLHQYDPVTAYRNVWTLENYRYLFRHGIYADSLVGTARLGIVVTVITLLAGYPVAWYLARSRSRLVPVVLAIVVAPMFISVVVRTFGWLVVLGRSGPINALLLATHLASGPLQLLYTLGATTVGLVHILGPLMILPIASVLRGQDIAVEEAARSLGASGMRVFMTVTLPLSFPGVAAGCLLVFAHAIAAFIMPALLGAERDRLMSTMIYQQVIVIGNVPLGAALGVVMVAAAFAAIGLLRLVPRGGGS